MSQSSESSSDSDVDRAELDKIKDAVCDIATVGHSMLTATSNNNSESFTLHRNFDGLCNKKPQFSAEHISEDFRRHIATKLQESLDGQIRFRKLRSQLRDENAELSCEASSRSGFRLFSSCSPERDSPSLPEVKQYKRRTSSSSDSEDEAERLSSVVVSTEFIQAASLPLQLNRSVSDESNASCHKTTNEHDVPLDFNVVNLSVGNGLQDATDDVDGQYCAVKSQRSKNKCRKANHKRCFDVSEISKSKNNDSRDLVDNVIYKCSDVNCRESNKKCQKLKPRGTEDVSELCNHEHCVSDTSHTVSHRKHKKQKHKWKEVKSSGSKELCDSEDNADGRKCCKSKRKCSRH